MSDFALPLYGLIFSLPCLLALHVMEDKKDPFAEFIGPVFNRAVLFGSAEQVAAQRQRALLIAN